LQFTALEVGETPNCKVVIIPLATIGILLLTISVGGFVSNNKRLPQYTEAFNKDKTEFVKSKKKIVEDFQYLYIMTIIIASVGFAIAIYFFQFTNNHILKAIGLALIILGLAGLIIVYFSKGRADTYYKAITTEMESHYN
jgi:ABC-type Fe3+-siderophore transport system permease subunit